jgi:penicillin-binding protein 1B
LLLSPIKRFALISAPFVCAALLAYFAYLDFTIRQQFEGKRWALPARVYAAPTELFAGAPMDSERLERLLRDLRYRSDTALSTRASFTRRHSEYLLKTREFRFWDKVEAARDLRIQLAGGQIQSVVDMASGRTLAIVRMEPVQIGSFYPNLKEDRILIRREQAPDKLLKALFSIEDRHFYEHSGISARSILRAIWANAQAGSIVQGGSTLTQQLVKNFYLSSERTWWRKINEAVMALILEARYSKDQILEAYLNEIYLGQDGARAVHGFGLASQYYFSRSLDELDLHHLALLVGMVRGPSYYDPFEATVRATRRRNVVLDAMAQQGVISEADAAVAKAKPLDVVSNPHQAISRYPAFLDLVRRQLQKDYAKEDLTTEGLRIFTTLEVEAQQWLESAASSTLRSLDRQTRQAGLETAGVITRRANGEIVALVGSRDPSSAGFNRALDAERQIGSLYKPVVYLTALLAPGRFTLATPLMDTALRIKNRGGGRWIPKNYDGREHGAVLLRDALAQSYNLATVRLGMNIGIAETLETLHRLGVDRTAEPYPALLLGTLSLSPLNVAQMYQTLANEGFATPLGAIQAVTDSDGKALSRYGLTVKQAVDPAAVYLVNTALQDAVAKGTGRAVYAYLPRSFAVAGKTGTTNDLRDSWFAGFTGDYLGVVWVGRDDNQSARLTGARGALTVWAAAMKHVAHEPVTLVPPDNIVDVWVDARSGLRSTEGCASAVLIPFISGSAPQGRSDCARSAAADDSDEAKQGDRQGLF